MPVEGTGKPCPDCKVGEVVIRVGKFGKFYSCSTFPECKYTDKLIEVVENVKCEKCGGDIVVKKTRTGKTFYGCGNYPKCDFASWNKPKAPGEVDTQTEQNVLD
jgi:DNA topoisomerase-1